VLEFLKGDLREALKSINDVVTSREVGISSIYTSAPPLNQKIPNTVYQTWKKPALPLRHAREVARFRKMNRDYSFCFFDDVQMAEYMNQHFCGQPILRVFQDLMIPASKADIWRYCILFREGGIYCDIDSALTVPFRELLESNPSELISFEGNKWHGRLDRRTYSDPAIFLPGPPKSIESRLEYSEHVVLNWLLCFEKGSPILAEVMDLIVRHADFFRGKTFGSPLVPIIHFTGPLAFTQAVWMYMQRTGKRPAQRGIDFNGKGIFKLPGERFRYGVSPHYSTMADVAILAGRGSP
jgi:hypothetical protein